MNALHDGAGETSRVGGPVAPERGQSMASANSRLLYNIAAAVVLALVAGWLCRDFWGEWRARPVFDDPYMFARYAVNLRHGLGLSWNLDGIHTYGMTSLMWCWVVTVLSYLPISTGKMLILGSRLSSIGALAALAWAVAANAKSDLLSSTWRVLPWIALPLAATAVFEGNAGNGMETMLAVLLCAVYVGISLKWQRGTARPEAVGLIGLLLYLTRPESAAVVVLFPLLLFVWMPGVSKRSLARVLGLLFAGVVAQVVVCKLYFHTPVPLAFYMKGLHAYEGYVSSPDWYPELYLLGFLGACELYLLAVVFLSRRDDWRLLACCIAPALVTFAYLQTVLQIWGNMSRYYAPYFALLIVPALLVIDRWFAPGVNIAGGESADVSGNMAVERLWPGKTLLMRSCIAGIVILCLFVASIDRVHAAIRRAENKTRYGYDPVRLEVAALVPLPELTPWDAAIDDVTDLLVAPLPKGATVAASEVGYLGGHASQINIIDLVGLNDTEIALHGFDSGALLARKPDIIWMPHEAYTYQRGVMLSDPELLREYDVYAGAASYGLAIRKDSPYRQQIDQQMQVFWSAAYPGYRMSDYLVKSASWTGQKHRVVIQ